jgi:hypothetical protein
VHETVGMVQMVSLIGGIRKLDDCKKQIYYNSSRFADYSLVDHGSSNHKMWSDWLIEPF